MKPVSPLRNAMRRRWPIAAGLLLPVAALADGIRDPMRPPVAPAAQAARAAESAPVLQAVFHAAGRRVAVINGRTAREGDTVAGLYILSIGIDSLQYRQGGRNGELKLGPSTTSIKQAARTPPAAPGAHVQ